jgi:hypothetical protein
MSRQPRPLVVLAFVAWVAVVGLGLRAPAGMPGLAAQAPSPAPGNMASVEEVEARCATACHTLPSPDILPRASWRDELVRMMLISEGVPEPAGASGFIPLPPDWIRILRYYEAHAPVRLPDPEPWPAPSSTPVAFTRRPLAALEPEAATAIANARLIDIDGDRRVDVLATDMRRGHVYAGLARKDFTLTALARLAHPSHIESVDLDRDGTLDLLVTDLGSYQPADHGNGALYWLRGKGQGQFETVPLVRGLPRIADARAADFDGDGDLDIVLANFGWRTTGSVTLLENRTKDWSSPAFVATVIDGRTGAIHVPITDVNKDGRPDVVALLAQEHESIVAFVNDGALAFTTHTIYRAPHPNWGSSGIELVDLDGDGDLDVLYTHGDTFDDFVVKPYHGVQWLENRGTYPYTAHTLAGLAGAQRAVAADVDGDGDLDVVATAMIAGGEINARLASIVWLEQVSPGVFERHTIEMGTPYHATLDIGDVDGDSRPDLLVGWFAFNRPLPVWLDLWMNGGAPRATR